MNKGKIYCKQRLLTTPRSELLNEIDEAPLTDQERAFIKDVVAGLSQKELADKYAKSPSRISHWKTEIEERLRQYDTQLRR